MKKEFNYAQLSWRNHHHFMRLRARIFAIPERSRLTCQECGGAGGWMEPILDDGSGPMEYCGWCEGLGYVTPWMRGFWLRYKREENNARSKGL